MTGAMEIRLGGSGGQGLLLSARILAQALVAEGNRVAQSQSYQPTSRGGMSRADLVVSAGAIDYPLVTALDYLVLLDRIALRASMPLVKPGATVLADATRVGGADGLSNGLPDDDGFKFDHSPLTQLRAGRGRSPRQSFVTLSPHERGGRGLGEGGDPDSSRHALNGLEVHMLPFADAARALGNERVANTVALGALAAVSGVVSRASIEGAIRAETPARFLEINLAALAEGFRLR